MSRAAPNRTSARTAPVASIVPPAGRARIFAVGAVPVLLIAIGAVVALVSIAAAGAAIAVLGALWLVGNVTFGAPARIAAELGGHDPRGEDARLVNIVDGLSVANGLGQIGLRIIDDDAANAIVVGRDASDAVLYCTSGLLAVLDRMELEGVVAHELAHLKRGEVTTASLITRALGLFGHVSEHAAERAFSLAGNAREVGADLDGAAMTRYPPGLHRALEKLGATPTEPRGLAPWLRQLTAPFWLVPLREAQRDGFDLSARLAALAEL